MLKPLFRVPCCLFLFLFISIFTNFLQAQCILPPATPICAGGNCDADAPTFTYNGITPPGPGVQYKWDFGDPAVTTDTLTTTTATATYAYEQPGNYTVSVKVFVNGVEQVAETCTSPQITVTGINQFTIGPDDENLGPQEEEYCIDDVPQQLEAVFQNGSAPAGATYDWTGPGVTDATRGNQSISINEEGCYSLTITANGCSRTNKLQIRLYKPDPTQPAPPQDQARWIFGTNVEVRFPGGQPNVKNERNINAPQGSSSVLGSKGELLFYTDGITIYDSLGNPMQDLSVTPPGLATNLTGSNTASQGVTIVAQPGCDNCQTIYYVFTTTEVSPSGSQVSYSVVDMSRNNNLGAVIQKNVPLSATIPSTERVISVQGNPSDPNAPATTWIITHDFATSVFRVYPLTAQGVGAPVTYDVGADHGPEPAQGEGYMKVSADGRKLAVVIPGSAGINNKVEIFDFDTATGAVSNPVTMDLGPVPPTAYGLEFAGQELYVSLTGSGAAQSQIVRFNLATSDSLIIAQSKDIVATSTQPFGALQTGPDQKIYVAKPGITSLGVINNPTAFDVADVDFQIDGLSLNGAQSGSGLPNNSPSSGNSYGQSLSYDGPLCAEIGETVQYTFQAQPDRAGGDPEKSSYQWLIRDASGAIIRSVARGANGQNASITVGMPGPGNYTADLTIYNDCNEDEGGEAVDQQQFTIFQSPPPVQLGPDRTVCTGTSVTLDAYTNTTGPAGALYFWTSPDGTTVRGAETFTATLGGAYQATVIVGECVETGTVNIILSGPPQNFLGADVTLCQPTSLVLDAGVATSGNFTYEWRNVTTGQVIGNTQVITVTPTTTTTYRATVTNQAANPVCTVTDDLIVTVAPPLVVTAQTTPATGCAGDPVNANGAITLTVPAGTFTYLWTKNGVEIARTQNLTGLEPGIYQVVVTNTVSGCSTTLNQEINSTATSLTLGPPTVQNAACAINNGSILINVTAGTPNSFTWRDAAGTVLPGQFTNVLLNAPPGTYSVEVGSAAGCSVFQTATINSIQERPVASPRAIITGCGQVTLFPGVSGTDFVYQWSLNGNDIQTNADGTATVTVSGNYLLRVGLSNNTQCFTEVPLPVTVTPAPPAISVAAPAAVCEGQNVTINASSPNWTIYTWTLPNNTTFSGPVLNAILSGTYRITVRNAAGCESTATVNVTINPAPARPTIANPAPVICSGGGIPPFTISSPVANATYLWYDNANLTGQPVGQGSSFTPNLTSNAAPGVYTYYVVQSANTCRSQPAEARLTINRSPVVNLGADRSICLDDNATLDATNQGTGVTYRWSTTETTPTIRPTRSGTYSVTVTIGNCSVTDEVAVTVEPSIRTNVVTREVALCVNDRPIIPVNLDAGPGDFTYFWPQLNSRERTVQVTQPGIYDVILTNRAGCTKTEKITVLERCDARVFVPDAFSPNQTGPEANNVLRIFGDYITDSRIEIYNRWGEVVFAADNILESGNYWDGTYLGQPAPVGTYAWKITYKSRDYPEREAKVIRGGVLLIR